MLTCSGYLLPVYRNANKNWMLEKETKLGGEGERERDSLNEQILEKKMCHRIVNSELTN